MMNGRLFLTAAALLLAGCSKSSQPDTPLRDTPISVNVLLPEILTRAGYGSNLPTLFYLSIDQSGDNYDYTNVVMKLEEGAWVAYESDEETAAKKQLLWEGTPTNIKVTAATFSLDYTTTSPSYTLSASADQSTDAKVKESDHLCYFNTDVYPSTEGISIEFGHIMSKLKITLTLGTEYEDATDNPISSVAVFGSNIKGTYDLMPLTSIIPGQNSEGVVVGGGGNVIVDVTKWSSQSENSIIKSCPLTYTSSTATSPTATYEAILIPQTIEADNFGVEILIGDKTYEWKSAAAVILEEGKEYTLELTAGKNKVSGSSFTASTWGSGTGISSATE